MRQRVEIGELVRPSPPTASCRKCRRDSRARVWSRPPRAAGTECPKHPLHRPVRQAEAVFLLERRQRVARKYDRLLDAACIVGVDEVAEDGGILGDLLGTNAEHVVEPDAGIGHARTCRPAASELQQAPRHDRGDLAVAILQFQPAHRLGDIVHRALVVERLAGSSRRARGERFPRSRCARVSCADRPPR